MRTELQNLRASEKAFLSEASDTQKEILRLIELKQLQEKNKLADDLELIALLNKHSRYQKLTSVQMQLQLKESSKSEEVAFQADKSIDLMLKDYKKKYGHLPSYVEPEFKNGNILLKFPSIDDTMSFFKEQSEKHRVFVILDINTSKIMAYSNGDGRMYHADGHEFKAGEQLTVSNINAQDFVIPAMKGNTLR